MNSSQFREWLEVIGIFGVLASLIFVGLQMKQDRTIAQATLYQMRADAVRELMAMQMDNRDLFELSEQPLESLTPGDFAAMRSGVMAVFSHFENSYNLYQLGLVTKEQWSSDIPIVCNAFSNPASRAMWERSKNTYRASFVEEVESACGVPFD